MYLSRLILNPVNRMAQRDIAFPYEMHRTIMQAFPDGLCSGLERVLFRLEPEPAFGGIVALVQSQEQPDWRPVITRGHAAYPYLLPEAQCRGGISANPDIKPYTLRLEAGQRLAFRLQANPTKRLGSGKDGDAYGKRVGIHKEEEQIDWLKAKSEQGGFQVLRVQSTRQDLAYRGRIERDGAQHPLRMLSVQFEGILGVVDPTRLTETVRQGIGSGKGIGFGLLSLAPLRS
jgi:CRISPR system Cascade subunit CasE